jgi:hypothetical protein
VLAVGLDLLQDEPVDEFRLSGKSTLGAGDTDGFAGEELVVILGDSVNGMAFGHVAKLAARRAPVVVDGIEDTKSPVVARRELQEQHSS